MLPDREGFWLHKDSGEIIEIYKLEPAGDVLCLWGPDVGMTYTLGQETQGVWTTDEWQGHIPIFRYDPDGDWELHHT